MKREIRGEVLFDAPSRGRYATDASIYQIEPVGVVVPRTEDDALVALQIAAEAGVPVLRAGGGTSQCGQTVGAALVIDVSKHLNEVIAFDKEARTACVQPGVVLDQLNAYLKPHGLWYPGGRVDERAGDDRRHGGQQLLRLALDTLRQHGAQRARGRCGARRRIAVSFRHRAFRSEPLEGPPGYVELVRKIRSIAAREAEEIEHRYPKLLRRVGGYNLDMMLPATFNMAQTFPLRGAEARAFRRAARSTWRISSSAPKARSPIRGASISISRRCRSTRRSACAISRRSSSRWKRRSTSSS